MIAGTDRYLVGAHNPDVASSTLAPATRRVLYNGITSGFQPDDAGSIPVTRSINTTW